jgi:acetoacetyl-CoA synthetase
MKVAVYDGGGDEVVGEKGELVCTAPFPSQPSGFWNDPDGAKYRAAYFERFPGVWCHGDWAELTAEGGLVIHGRSDAVLNPGGVRIGTAEIYRIVDAHPDVAESVVVGLERGADVEVALFVVMAAGVEFDEGLAADLKTRIRREASPRHVPAVVRAVPEIPRTLSGKTVELAVREALHGRPVANLDALANPGALEHFRSLHADLEA